LTPTTNIGASAEGAEMITFLAPPFKWADAFSTVVNTPYRSIMRHWFITTAKLENPAYRWLYNVISTSFTPFNGRRVPLSEYGNWVTINYKFAVLDLNGSLEATMGGVILEHVNLNVLN
jgi:hypothetical protein